MFYLVCAVALAPDVGVDVEDIERPVKPERLQTSPFHWTWWPSRSGSEQIPISGLQWKTRCRWFS